MYETTAKLVVCAPPAPNKRAFLQTITVGYPLQMMAMDLLGPLPESKAGNSYVLVVADYFTHWMEVSALPNQEASAVAKALVPFLPT